MGSGSNKRHLQQPLGSPSKRRPRPEDLAGPSAAPGPEGQETDTLEPQDVDPDGASQDEEYEDDESDAVPDGPMPAVGIPRALGQPDSPVDFTSSAVTFGQILLGTFGQYSGRVQLVIDPVQRPYGWSAEDAKQTAESLLEQFRLNIAKYSFGEATIHNDPTDSTTCSVLNGQQRLITITILLSVLRHLASTRFPAEQAILDNELKPDCFTFKQGRQMRDVTRIRVRKLQSEVWSQYISPAADNLGGLWNEDGELRWGLAGSDTITRKFMQAAHAIKQALQDAEGRNGVMLFDNFDHVLDFIEQVRDRTHLAWSKHVGGGNSYKCTLYAQSNRAQMCATEVDMLKAALLSKCTTEESEAHADDWDGYLLQLNDFSLASLGNRTMFEHIFHTIYLLTKSSTNNPQLQTSNMCNVFVEDPALNVKRGHSNFMENLFLPVAAAMDKIFNWKTRVQIPGASRDVEHLLDQIKTSCRLLLDVGNGEHNRPSLSYWLGSCAVPLFIQLWPKAGASAASVKVNLKELAVHLQALERRTMWQWLHAPHAQVSRNILMYGGQVKQSDKKSRTIPTGVLRLLNRQGSINATWAHDREVLEVLKLKDCEAKDLLKKVINMRYNRRVETKKKLRRLLMIYDDELRNPTDGGQVHVRKISDYDYDDRLTQAGSEVAIAHLVPQTLTDAHWKDLWPNSSWHLQVRHMLGNLALLPTDINSALGNKGLMAEALAMYKAGPVPYLCTGELTEDDWVIQSFITRHKKMIEAIARRLALPIGRYIGKLPRISEDPAGEDQLENTAKIK